MSRDRAKAIRTGTPGDQVASSKPRISSAVQPLSARPPPSPACVDDLLLVDFYCSGGRPFRSQGHGRDDVGLDGRRYFRSGSVGTSPHCDTPATMPDLTLA